MKITRERSLAWLKPMLDELGININLVMGVRFDHDEVVITCAYTPDPSGEHPPAEMVPTGQIPPGLDDFAMLSYRICLEITDADPTEKPAQS